MIAKLVKVLGQFHIRNDSRLLQSVHALHKLLDENRWVYLEIVKGMYGLKQAVIIANMELTKHLEKFCYHPVLHTPGLWKHNTRETISERY